MPRPNGYQSLHTSVISEHGMPFEVQIRTMEQHRRAEEGIAAHWKYKEGRVGDQRDDRYFQWMRQLLESQQEVRDPQEFIQNLKVELYPEEVYIFTPKGLVKALPRGATPVDFAYSIHTDRRDTSASARASTARWCRCARASRTATSSRSSRQAGHRPSRDWLNFVATSRARNKIKHLIHSEEKTRAVELGRKLFEKEARRYDLNPKTIVDGERVREGAGRLRRRQGRRSVRGDRLRQDSAQAGARPARAGRTRCARSRPKARSPSVVRRVLGVGRREDQGQRLRRPDGVPRALLQSDPRREDRRLHHARQRRVSVHSATCPNVVNLLYDPERRIEVEWDKSDAVARYTVKLTMEVEDRKGLLAAVSAKIADINTNIKNMEARTDDDQHARIDMTVEISDLKHLEKVIKSLQGRGRSARRRTGGPGGGSSWLGARCRRCRSRPLLVDAITSISTRASFGSRATCTVARAG